MDRLYLPDTFVAQKIKKMNNMTNSSSMKSMSTIDLKDSPWYKTWFDSSYYHQLYKNRNLQEAADFIDHLLDVLQPPADSKMIDVGCGAGRHSRELAGKGYDVIGVDLSIQSIREAKKHTSASLMFIQHDMRKSFGSAHFDYVFNFFTSFGYFRDEREHALVLQNMSSALKPGGKLVLDYMNIHYAEKNLVRSEQKEIDGIYYTINRWMDQNHFYKQISIENGFPGSGQVHIEKVARFSLEDFKKMFASCGMQIEQVFGDYAMNPFDSCESPRLIMVCSF
jgi:SAM-dependent methyltransferase